MQKLVIVLLISSFVFSDFDTIFDWPHIREAFAAQVTIDTTVSTNSASHTNGQASLVFISDQVGYKFYRDGGGGCVYSKTTNGGTGWNTPVVVDSQTDCEAIEVWYDQWTPGDTGTYIHIATMDSIDDDIWYNRLDTSSDTRLLGTSPVSVVTDQATLSISAATANHSITKGTDGILHIVIADSGDRFMKSCSATCQTAGNWTESGNGTQMDQDEDLTLLLPLDSGSILLINRDITADDLRSKVWNGSSWSGSWSAIDSGAPEGNTYDIQMTAVRSPVSGDVYLAYISDADTFTTADHDIRVAKYSGGSWTNLSNVITNDTRGLTSVSLSVDENNDTVYLAYTARTTIGTPGTANLYFATSTSAMTSWSAEQGPVNSSPGDIYGASMNYYSDQRIYATWYEAALDDMFGDTIANISPATTVSVSGTQQSDVRASSTDFYLGGKFTITEETTSRNVTDITITENGSVNGATALDNIELKYDLDTSNPYDCASESYGGGESQFGSTDTNGFSGSDGVSAFSGSVSISPTQAMCVYVIVDVLTGAADGGTIDVEISNPATDVLVTGGVTSVPTSVKAISGLTNIANSDLTQTHFHWRNDDGNEGSATSKTGGSEDVNLSAIQVATPARVRIGVSNEGSTSSLSTTFRLEYALNTTTCDLATGWTDVNATDDDWNMYDSTFITNGTDSTDISNAIGGVSNENSVLLTPNGGLRDTSSTLGGLVLLPTNWVETEFSIVASTSAAEGDTYCFRLTNNGEELPVYTNYPKATVAADVSITATGTQSATVDIPTSDFYIGGKFLITENSSARNVTHIKISENGTVNGTTSVENIRLYYDLDTTAPYTCDDVSYGSGDSQFGTASSSFSAEDGFSVFTGSVGITTTQTMCVYPVLDINENARNGETMNIRIESAASDVKVTGAGTVAPASAVDIASSTTLAGGIVTQTNYHWRNDDGTESGATSATGGNEDEAILDFTKNTPIRLRIGLSNEGSTTSISHRYRLEYGVKSTTCENITVWSDADDGGVSWSMYDSAFLTNGETTTDIAEASGGLSNPNSSFLGANGGVRDTESLSATTSLTESEYVDLEYSIIGTNDVPYNTTFCFRVTQGGNPLLQYDIYPEITTEERRDFRIQRGTTTVSGTGVTLTAGVDYTAPSASTSAFVRITNSHYTGAGKTTLGGNQNTDDYAAYISNAGNIVTNFTISRDTDSINNTYVAWEIVEYIGIAGGDNEMIVRDQNALSLGATSNIATGTASSNVVDDSDVVVFITGQFHDGGNRSEAFAHQFTSAWSGSTDSPVFTRGAHGGNNGRVSYAVVEFTGLNWKIQRAQHSYTNDGVAETEAISAVNSLSRTFLHAQKRYDSANITVANFGHQVWLSSIGAVSFMLDSNATTTGINHVAVAWVIENTQTGTGEMVTQRSNGTTNGGVEPFILTVDIPTRLNATNNASIFLSTSINGTSNTYPQMIVGAAIVSTSSYQLWRSDSGSTLAYRTEIVQWPAADLAFRQNYYRFYADNDLLIPSDPWPIGVTDLGENTPIGALDEPLADTDHIRIRMSVKVANATLPAGFLSAKLQYGLRSTTCSAIQTWSDVGAVGSGAIWRGYNAPGVSDGVSLSTNPPTGGDLLISVSDRAGVYTESAPSDANPYATYDDEEIEFDWHIEQNGATQRKTYCFRMINSDDTPFSAYFNYPQIRTEGYTPVITNWRWYDDETNETPITPLALEDTAPANVLKGNAVKLRVTLDEIKNLSQLNARFKIQFSEQADFSDAQDVVASTTCTASSVWCYYDGAGVDNNIISSSVLTDSDTCVAGVGAGCGTHNESSVYYNGFTHSASDNTEYEFTLLYTNVDRNYGKVYYFRLYDLANEEVITASSSYPSLAGESASLSLTIDGVDTNVTIAGITTDATTTATTINFGSLPLDSDVEVAQEVTVNTNAIEGYQVYKYADQQLMDSYANEIEPITGTNASPLGWATACSGPAVSCFGYHTTDATLASASGRFAPIDSYAALDVNPQEIMYSSIAAVDTEQIIYRIRVSSTQPAGDYQTDIVYLAIPTF